MEKFTKVTGVAAPLMRQNVDTDLVIRIERLVNNTSRQGLGPYCFEQIRFKPDGSENPDCILNQEPYRGAPIILSAENFGCGSSREGAVWALAGMGVKAVIAPSYGDIFYNNCFQNGLLPVVVDESTSRWLIEHPGAELTIDLESTTLALPGGERVKFPLEGFSRYCLMNGVDELGFLLGRMNEIKAYEQRVQA